MTHIKASQKVFEIAPIGMYARTTQGWADMFENTGRFTDRSRRDRFMPPDPFQISRPQEIYFERALLSKGIQLRELFGGAIKIMIENWVASSESLRTTNESSFQ
ncbi:UNVERIFIED_CONTAM: hypothetical protein NCL1_09537 [Trichonephila clavipes]